MTTMNWLGLSQLQKDVEKSNFLQNNWTKPFFKNVLFSFNSSVNGPQEFGISKQLGVFIDDIFSHNATQAAQYGGLTSLFLIFIINTIFYRKDTSALKNVITLHRRTYVCMQTCLFIASYLLTLLSFPLIVSILAIFFVFKMLVKIVLKYKYANKFMGMMDSTDTVWAIEEENAKSIINVISKVEPQKKCSTVDGDKYLLSKLRKIFLLMHPESVCPKMFYQRFSFMGYHFWIDNKNIHIEDHIKPMKINKNLEMTEDNLMAFVGSELNSHMPCNNTASWEILVGDRPMKNTLQFPILFRIHHTLGDGVALLALLLNTIGSTDLDHESPNFKSNIQKNSFRNWLGTTLQLLTIRNFITLILNCHVYVMKITLLICRMPISLINQAMRPPDNNILHGPELSGNKTIAWISDENCSGNLLHKIKQMKKRMSGVTFSELFLTAISSSFHKFFNQKTSKMQTPEIITAVVPVRMNKCNLSKPNKKNLPLKLENKFSVAMLTIPIENKNTLPRGSSILKRLIAVRKETTKLRRSADFHVNYWLMKAGGYFLPEIILKPMLTSVQASIVVSNLPGPSDVTLYGGYKLNKLAFFVPHRGTTGIGISIISCNDRINLGIMADSTLINNSEDGTFILKNIIKELELMDSLTSRQVVK